MMMKEDLIVAAVDKFINFNLASYLEIKSCLDWRVKFVDKIFSLDCVKSAACEGQTLK
jgi:hypothetical protein